MDIQSLLEVCLARGASDLHLSAGLPVLLRIDGDLLALNEPALSEDQVLALINVTMNEDQREDFLRNLESDYAFELGSGPGAQAIAMETAAGSDANPVAAPTNGRETRSARFRVNAFRHRRGPGAVFRVIPGEVPSLDSLNAPKALRDVIAASSGLVLVTGPTGSGKSTTLAAMIDALNRERAAHILTIEDPIEFVHRPRRCLINQRELHRDTQSFGAALRSALRQDPDIILVGELRDLETIRLALTAAETGHLVFATLHTSSAPKTIDRIIDVFPGPEKALVRSMLSGSLRAVIAQTLLKRIGGGRVAAHEIMIATPAIRNLIREDKVAQMRSSIQTGQALGMQSLDQALKALVAQGQVSLEEARAKAADPAAFT